MPFLYLRKEEHDVIGLPDRQQPRHHPLPGFDPHRLRAHVAAVGVEVEPARDLARLATRRDEDVSSAAHSGRKGVAAVQRVVNVLKFYFLREYFGNDNCKI